ncbi:MAG: hypothetical protein M3Y56_00140, partial [Armatimonadota bacterium]|nr:hypothetical protein [Armatimonadota bacterium]
MKTHQSTNSTSSTNFVRFFVVTLLVCCLGLGGLNYTVNPFGFYAPHLVRQLTWDEVQLKTSLMRQQPSPDILILGSSRVMTIAPEDVQAQTGQSAFNAGTGAASPLDSCAVFRYALESLHWHPRELILGIDVNGFNHPFANQAVLATQELSPYLPRAAKWAGLWERWNVLLSTGQIIASLKSLRLALRKTGYPSPSVQFAADGLALLPAGDQWEDRNLKEAIRFWSLQDADFNEFSVDQQRSFEEMLQVAVAHNIKVVGYITPFHPSLL